MLQYSSLLVVLHFHFALESTAAAAASFQPHTKGRNGGATPLLLLPQDSVGAAEAAAAEARRAKGKASFRQRLVNVPVVGRKPRAAAEAAGTATPHNSNSNSGGTASTSSSVRRRPLRKTLQQIIEETRRTETVAQQERLQQQLRRQLMLQHSESLDREQQKDELSRSFQLAECSALPPKARLPSLTSLEKKQLLFLS